jgi:hypothetical protein
MASGAPSLECLSDKISGKAAAGLRRLLLYALRRPRLPPRRVKETVSGRADAINWMTLLFAQFID